MTTSMARNLKMSTPAPGTRKVVSYTQLENDWNNRASGSRAAIGNNETPMDSSPRDLLDTSIRELKVCTLSHFLYVGLYR